MSKVLVVEGLHGHRNIQEKYMNLIFYVFDQFSFLLTTVVAFFSFVVSLFKKARGKKNHSYIIGLVVLILYILGSFVRNQYDEVPNVVNLTYDSAKQTLKESGFQCNDDFYDSDAIITQQYIGKDKKYTIDERKYALKNEYIYLEISEKNKVLNTQNEIGNESFTIPNLLFNDYLYAVECLYSLGAGEVKVEYQYSENIVADIVIGTEPQIGTEIEKGAVITIYVSKNKFSESQLELNDKEYSNFLVENTKLLNYLGNDRVVLVPDGVEIIGQAFYQAADSYIDYSCIEEIVLPDSVKVIEKYAFREMQNLKKITLSENLEYIDKFAFAGCEKLEEVVIPDSVKFIGTQAFFNCNNLKKINLPENITVGYAAFVNSGLQEVNISNNVRLDSFVFAECEDLERINIPDDLEVGEGCFCGNAWLKTVDEEFLVIDGRLVCYSGTDAEVQVPENVDIIDAYAFEENEYINKVIIGDNVKAVNTGAFRNCTNLSVVAATSSLKTISKGAFLNTAWIANSESAFIMLGDGILVEYIGDKTEVLIPNDVKRIADAAFENKTNIVNVQMENNVVEIGQNAFSGCENLKNIKLSNEISVISTEVFAGCGIETIDLPDKLKFLSNNCFAYCMNLKEIEFPVEMKYVGEETFRGCTSLGKILFNNNLVVIGQGAFANCSSLCALEIPKSVEEIGAYAFFNCSGLQNINFYHGLKNIGEGAFSTCSGLKEVLLPDSVCELGVGAFMMCSNLSRVYLGSIREINVNTFLYCTNLTEVEIPQTVRNIRYHAFEGCYNLKNVFLPNDLQMLGTACFYACGLEKIDIPSNVLIIGEAAFAKNNNLKEVYICDGVSEIGYMAFAECPLLETVYIPVTISVQGAFLDIDSNADIIPF